MEKHTKTVDKKHQPLEALHVDDALLRLETVMAVTALGRTSIYEKMREMPPTFPAAIKRGKRNTRWRAGDIKAYLQGLTKGVA